MVPRNVHLLNRDTFGYTVVSITDQDGTPNKYDIVSTDVWREGSGHTVTLKSLFEMK